VLVRTTDRSLSEGERRKIGGMGMTGAFEKSLPKLRSELGICQQNRRARLAIDFSTNWACISHASDVLGACVMITSALLRAETERWREKYNASRKWVPWQAWHDNLGLKMRDTGEAVLRVERSRSSLSPNLWHPRWPYQGRE
jgi:hypothetical protein